MNYIFLETGDRAIPEELLHNNDIARRQKWGKFKTKEDLKTLQEPCVIDSEYTSVIGIEDITSALKEVKLGKAPGINSIHSEFLLQVLYKTMASFHRHSKNCL